MPKLICKLCQTSYHGRAESFLCSKTCSNRWRTKKSEIVINEIPGRMCKKCQEWKPLYKMCAKGRSNCCMSCNRKEPEQKFSILKSQVKTYRHLSFTISLDEYKYILNQKCFYCSDPSTGIDRLDSSRGYDLPNLVPCCRICNFGKSDLTYVEFIAHCKKIQSYQSKV